MRHTLHKWRYRLGALPLIQVYLGSKFCPSLFETVGLRVATLCIRDSSMFSLCSSSKTVRLLEVHQLLIWFVRTLIITAIVLSYSLKYYSYST
jgi:hypothetical protein